MRSLVSADESEWHETLFIACFRYNTTMNSTTKMTPYKAVFGMEAFNLDYQAVRRMMIDLEAMNNDELCSGLKTLYKELLSD